MSVQLTLLHSLGLQGEDSAYTWGNVFVASGGEWWTVAEGALTIDLGGMDWGWGAAMAEGIKA
jgi:hypothetical protein